MYIRHRQPTGTFVYVNPAHVSHVVWEGGSQDGLVAVFDLAGRADAEVRLIFKTLEDARAVEDQLNGLAGAGQRRSRPIPTRLDVTPIRPAAPAWVIAR